MLNLQKTVVLDIFHSGLFVVLLMFSILLNRRISRPQVLNRFLYGQNLDVYSMNDDKMCFMFGNDSRIYGYDPGEGYHNVTIKLKAWPPNQIRHDRLASVFAQRTTGCFDPLPLGTLWITILTCVAFALAKSEEGN